MFKIKQKSVAVIAVVAVAGSLAVGANAAVNPLSRSVTVNGWYDIVGPQVGR